MSSSENEQDIPEETMEEEVDIPVEEVLEKITEAWINEKFAPVILPSNMDLAESLLNGTHEVKDNLKSTSNHDLLSKVQEMEIDRVNYLLSSYARIRLRKIEDLIVHIFGDKTLMSRLSPKESEYASEFSKSMSAILDPVVKQMPPNVQSDTRRNVPQKSKDTFVFFEVIEKLEQVVFETDDEPMDLDEGSRHLMRYKLVEPLLLDGSVKLV